MKLNLFLLASIFAASYLCEAGPLRLQKRAAFYIANETACVVDNIVYSSGDPIPTDDPCEACKCRPPGFACVLKECRVKPGCRAVRHAGQCCPEYVCGCEHNGRMYQDGEEIRDAKNPCYVCHCQGSSIACAFVDCLFRADCPPVYVPGECCPEYANCTKRDAPENIPLKDPVPFLNLLPGLNDESVIVPEKIPTTPKAVSPTEVATHPPTQSSHVTERSTEGNVPDVKISSEFQTEVPSSVSVENKPALIPGENNFVEESVSSETKTDALSQDGSEDKVEKNDENISSNSEAEITKDEDFETTTLILPVSRSEIAKDQEIKTASETETGKKAEVPENESESDTIVAEIPTTEKTVKNSAAINSKSLKLSDDETIPENEKFVEDKEIKTDLPVQGDTKTTETQTQPSTESSSKINSITSTKTEPESAENIAEESQIKPQSSFFSNNEKIKSETAETVTIVVHVKDKTKTTIETNIEHVTLESETNATQENLLHSKDELNSTEPAKDDETTLVEISSEASISATEPNKKELSTLSPLTDEKLKDAESRSEKTDMSSEPTQNSVSNYETTSKIEEVSSVVTIAQDKHVTESTPPEARAEEEETEKEKKENLKILESKDEEPKVSASIQATTISEKDLKTNEAKENQTKYEGTTEIPASETTATEIKVEVRESEIKSEEEREKTSTEKAQETTPEEKVASTTIQTEIKTEPRSAEIESKEILSKNIETTTAVEIQEQKHGVTTESVNQDIKTSVQTEAPKTDSE